MNELVKTPKVSVIISVRNQSGLLGPCMASVVGQSFKDWEMIVVDDGSDEDIKGVCDAWNDERIQYVRFPENRGFQAGFSHAYSLATGEYIQILSADERLDLNKLLWQVGYLDEHVDVHGLWGLPQNGELGERPEWEQHALKASNRSNDQWIRTLLTLDNIPIGGASWLVRKSVLDDIGLLKPEFHTCSDLEMFVRFFEKGYKGLVMPYRWAWCEDNPNSLSRAVKASEFQKDIENVREAHKHSIKDGDGIVTIGIPVKNMANWIGSTLDSIKAQTYTKWKVEVFDDGSSDDLLSVLGNYPDVRVTRIEESAGPSKAQTHMLANCQTEFFVILAADDTLEPTFLEKCVAEFRKDPFLEFVASQTDFIDKEGKPHEGEHGFKGIIKAGNKPREEWIRQLYYGNQYFGCGMYRTQSAKDVGGWEDWGVLSDYDMYLKLLHRNNIKVIEENLTHTRIHDNNRSIGSGMDWALNIRNTYHKIKKKFYPPRMKVIIVTPFYELRGFSPYIVSMVGTIQLLTRMGIENEFWELSGDSYVERAKNTLLNKFLEDPAATHLFMIDSDMQWEPMSFFKMLMLPEDIVMGSYPQKNSWEMWTARPFLQQQEDGKHRPVGRILDDGSALVKAQYLAGGFIRITRKCLEEYKEKYPDLIYKDQGADPSYPDRTYTEFFTCERAPLDENDPNSPMFRWGEDRVFGKRMLKLGIEPWIYPNLNMGHYGVKGWMGNFDKYLRTGSGAP